MNDFQFGYLVVTACVPQQRIAAQSLITCPDFANSQGIGNFFALNFPFPGTSNPVEHRARMYPCASRCAIEMIPG